MIEKQVKLKKKCLFIGLIRLNCTSEKDIDLEKTSI